MNNGVKAESTDRELVATRIIAAPPELVFAMWTDPEHVSNWWGPDGFATTTHVMDLRPGGEWRFTMHGPDGRDCDNRIEYIEVVKPSRIAYRHSDEGEAVPVRFHSTVTFEPLDSKTLLTMRMVFESPEAHARIEDEYGAREGLVQTLARFSEHIDSVVVDTE